MTPERARGWTMAGRDVVAAPRTSWVAGAFVLLAAAALWPAYFSKLPQGDELYVGLHTVGVVAWMALLVLQPILIWRRQRPLHRRLGVAAYVVAPFVVVSSILLARSRLDPVAAPT